MPLVHHTETSFQRENSQALCKRSSFSSHALAEGTLKISFYPAIKLVSSPLAFPAQRGAEEDCSLLLLKGSMQHLRDLMLNYGTSRAIDQMGII